MTIGLQDLGIAITGDIADLQRNLAAAGAGVDNFGRKTQGALRGVNAEAKQTDDALSKLANGIRSAFVGSSVAVGLITLKNTVVSMTGALVDAQVQLDRLNNGFRFGAGSSEAGAKEMAFVRSEVDRLGLSLGSTASQYMKMVAASRGNAMAGEKTRQLFTSIAEASVVMGMGQEQSERAMMAVVQMMSKGKVMAEELRGQLGEHLPGAFSIAARAMGVTEVQLNKMMETGSVLADDFLPKFAAQLRKELAGSVEQSALSMQANLNRLSTAWLDFKQQLAQGGVGTAIASQTKALATELTILGDVLEASRERGDGFWMTMANTAGAAAGRVGFQVLQDSANATNAALNFATLGVLDLNTSLDLVPDNLKPVAQQMELTAQKVKQAESEYAALSARLAQAPDNIYIKSELGNLARYIATLRLAQDEQRKMMGLSGATGSAGAVPSGDTLLARAQREDYNKRLSAQQAAMRKYATPQEKLTEEIKAQRAALGDLFTPELERRITENFVKPTRAGGRAARDAKDEFAELYNKLTAKDAGLDPSFYKDLNTLYQGWQKGRIGIDEYRAAVEAMITSQKFATDAAKEAQDAAVAAAQSNNAAFDEWFDASEKKRLATEAQIKTGREMLEQIQFETELLGMNTQQRELATAMRELERAGVVKGTLAYEAYAAAIQKAIIDREQAQQMKDFWEDVNATAENVFVDIAMNGEDAFKRIGQSIKREVIQMLYEMTVKKWIIQVSGQSTLGGGSSGSLLDSASSAYSAYSMAASGGAGSVGAAGSMSAIGSYAGGSMSGANAAGSIYANASGTGMNGLLATNGAYGTAASGAGASSASWMTAAWWAAVVVAAVAVAENLYSKGYNREAVGHASNGGTVNQFGNTTFTTDQNMGRSFQYDAGFERMKAKTLEWAGLSEKWVDILSGTTRMAALFGRKLGAYGYEANIAGGDASVGGFARYKGGLFRSNKTVGVDVDQRDAAAFDAVVEATIDGTRAMARAMGYSADAIDSYTGKLRVNFKGANTAAEQAERMAEAMDDLQYSLLKAASGGKMAREEFDRMMEQALANAEGVGITGQSISDVLVNGMTQRLGAEQTGAQMADLIAGGIIRSLAQNYTQQVAQMFMTQIITPVFTAMMAGVPLSQAISQASIDQMVSYAQNAAAALNAMLNSEEMRAAIGMIGEAAASVGQAFGGIEMPSFGGAAEMEAVNQAEQQRYAIETELLGLLGNTTLLRERELAGLDGSAAALKRYVYTLEDARTAMDAALSAVERSIEAEKDRVNSLLDTARDAESALNDVFQTLRDNMRDMRGEVASTYGIDAFTARGRIGQAISGAIKLNNDDLTSAIDAVRNSLDEGNFASAFERDVAYLRFAGELSQLQGVTEKELSSAEQQVLLLEQQLSGLDSQLEWARAQVDAILGVDNSIKSVDLSMAGLSAAMAVYTSTVAAAMAQGFSAGAGPSSGGGGFGGFDFGGGEPESSGGSWNAEGYWSKNGDLRDYWNANEGSLSRDKRFNQDGNLSARDEYLRWHWSNYGQGERRQFAVGGAFTNSIVRGPTFFDMGQMGEAGDEGILPLANIGGRLGVHATTGSDVETKALLRELIAEVKAAKTASREQFMAGVSQSKAMQKILERWETDGLPEVRDLAAVSA